MKHFSYEIMIGVFALCGMQTCDAGQEYIGIAQEIPEDIRTVMTGRSWKPECPVPLEDLRYLTMSYWSFEGVPQIGHMVVHKKVAAEIVAIFKVLFDARFPIERMDIVDAYDADDDLSMAANNTSAFCCRAITNKPGTFSKHSYGLAIDINPAINPYVKNAQVLPPMGSAYLDRTISCPGMITDAADNICYQAFARYGWSWGGHWMPIKGYVDYQHFEKDPSILQESV